MTEYVLSMCDLAGIGNAKLCTQRIHDVCEPILAA